MLIKHRITKIHKGKTSKHKYVQRFYKELLIKENRKTIVSIVFLSLCKILIELVPPVLMIRVLDHAIPAQRIYDVFYLGFGILLFTLLESVLNYFLNKIYCDFGNKIYVGLQKKCIFHLLDMKGEYFSNVSNGEMFVTLFQDITNIKGFTSKTVFQFVSDVILAICMFWFLLYLQWDLLMVMVMILPFVYFSQKYFQDIQKKKMVLLRESCSSITGLLEDMVSNTMAILYSKGERFFEKKYCRHMNEYIQQDLEIELEYAKNDGILKFLSAFINIVVLAYGGIKIITGSLTIGEFMAFNMYSSKLAVPIFEASAVLMEFQTRTVSLQKVYQFLDLPGIKEEKKKKAGIDEKGGNIAFQEVEFSYEGDKVLKKFSLDFMPNSVNVVVGESGVGKSTIVSLLYRFWDIQNGSIKINKTDIKEYDVGYLRQQVTVVSQDMYLFNDTIFNNIVLELDREKDVVEKAAYIACIHDFILSMPDGYNTIIGEKGVKLSGGERQRICLARAFLRDTPILVLDEATSALDQLTEKQILDNIKEFAYNKTIILITHRLSSITDADCIYVLKDGECIDKGKHEDLIESNAYYQKLYRRGECNGKEYVAFMQEAGNKETDGK